MMPTDDDFYAILKQARATLYRVRYENSQWAMICTNCGGSASVYGKGGAIHTPECVVHILRRYACQPTKSDT